MSTTQYLLILALIVYTSGHLHKESHESSKHNRRELLDPLHHVRESCRKELDLTKDNFKSYTEGFGRKRHELKDLDKNGEDIEDYSVCFTKQLGLLHQDGTVKKHAVLKAVNDVIPKTLREPLMNHCLHKVYHGEVPHPHKIYQLWTSFVLCVKSRLTPEMWDLMGGFAAPEYAPLDICEASY